MASNDIKGSRFLQFNQEYLVISEIMPNLVVKF